MPRSHLPAMLKIALLAGTSLIPVCAAAQEASGEPEITTVTVIGSNIPRTQKEGPAPVTTITAQAIKDKAFKDVPDLLASVTQNTGLVQGQQSNNGADFSPGGQQVNLRGLGPNHTLVLVNGRRIADYPMPFNGKSNFTDVSNIPMGMVDSVEILSGSASAIYGSDAIAGVVNFKLKKKADGTTFDISHGFTEQGGGKSLEMSVSSGFDADRFHAVFGVEVRNQRPLWGYQRERQDSTLDAPTARSQLPERNFMIQDENEDYLDPGKATCDALSGLSGGTMQYALRPRYGYYCGSTAGVAYRTVVSERVQLSGLASLTYELNDTTTLFADIQVAKSKVKLMRPRLTWYYQPGSDNEDSYFYNANSGQLEDWNRTFTPEEMGGLEKGMRQVDSQTFTLSPGIRGTFGEGNRWSYDLAFNFSRFESKIAFPLLINAKATKFFLGDQLGTDSDGYPIFAPSYDRFYTPLTPAEYDSLVVKSIYKPSSWTNSFKAVLSTGELFQMPAGPVGFAVVAEAGRQGYDLSPDPLATQYYYWGWKDADGKGGRSNKAIGAEFQIPLLSNLSLSLATRYDQFGFAGRDTDKVTYNTGLEYRPVKSLLLRATYGTAFRAPDLHYIYTGPGNEHPSVVDQFKCRTEEPGVPLGDCSLDSERIIKSRVGNRDLKSETGTSFTAGFVWAPSRRFDVSLDYYKIEMKDQVEDLEMATVLKAESDCRFGSTTTGAAVAPNSPTCKDALSRVKRNSGGDIMSIFINPINVASQQTSGLDLSLRFGFDTPIGQIDVSGGHTYVIKQDYKRYAGDTYFSMLTPTSGYELPRNKSNLSVSLRNGPFKATLSGRYVDRTPNYDEDAYVSSYSIANGSIQYDVTDKATVSFSVRNLFDTKPVYDPTWTGYPYYNHSWFDGIGREGTIRLTYKM